MNRNRGNLRGFGQGSGGSIKDRLGGGGRAQSAGIFKGNRVGKRTGNTLAPGKMVASRLGLPVKGRGGGRGGGVVDAREKIILNRVSKGRIGAGRLGNRLSRGVAKAGPNLGDARARIEAKRVRTKGPGGHVAAPIDQNSLRSLKITANLSSGGAGGMVHMPMTRSLSLSTGHGRKPGSEGIFANQMGDRGDPRSMPYGAGRSQPMRVSVPTNSRMDNSNFLTRTVMNNSQTGRGAWPGGSASRRYDRDDDMDMDMEDVPARIRISNNLQSRLDTRVDEPQRYRVVVSNLQGSVTTEDIIELFGDIATPISAKMTSPGMAEVVYHRKADCVKAIEAYHNRLLDGSPMKVVLDGGSTLKSAAGASIKLPKASSSSVKIAPDIGAIHKVLFTSSGNSTRGLFKGGQ